MVAGSASASTTRLFLRISGGVKSLSLASPTEPSANPVCPGGASGCTEGCAYVLPEGDRDCGNDITDPAGLTADRWTTFSFVTPESWGRDSAVVLTNPTNFSYQAGYCGASGGWAQPALRITYQINDGAGTTVQDIEGVPCPACQSTLGCQLDSATKMLDFDKTAGGNVSTVSENVIGSLPTTLPAGSTITVDAWNANGQALGVIYSYDGKESFIDVPYSQGNFSIRGGVSPRYARPGVTRTFTFTLDNSADGSPTLTKLEITIPGGISGGNLFFASVQDPPTVSRTVQGTVVTQASSGGNGQIAIDFGSNVVAAGSTVYVTFTATAPVSAIQNVKWDAVAYAGPSLYTIAEATPDALYTAILDPPPAPTGLTVSPQNVDTGGQSLTLRWNGPSPVDTYGVTTYVVYRPTSTAAGFVPPEGGYLLGNSVWHPLTILVTQVNGVNWTETGLVNGTCYCYTVASANPVGISAQSALICGTPYEAPSPPNSVTLLVASGQARLAWDPVPDNAPYTIAGYEIFRASCAACGLAAYQTIATPTTTVFVESALSNSALYTYEVRAYDAQGHRGQFSALATGRPAVNPPSGLTPAYDYAGSGVTLRWQASQGNAYPLAAYNVYRSTCVTCAFGRLGASPTLASPAATVYLDAGVAVAKLYYYAVSAFSTEGGSTEGPMSAVVKILVPPAAPSTLTVLPSAGSALYVEWSIAPNAPGTVDGYRLYRTSYAGVPLTGYMNATVGQTATAVADGGLDPGVRYYYRAAAYLRRGTDYAESPGSPERNFVVEPGSPGGLTDQAGDTVVHLQWTDLRPAQEVDRYNVYRSSESTGLPFVLLFSGTAYVYDDGGVTNGIRYYYRVTAVNAGGEGAPAQTTVGTIPFQPPGVPGPVAGFAWVGQTSLVWDPAIPTTYPIGAYEIWRTTTATQEVYHKTTTGSATFYKDSTNVGNGKTYFYTMRAQDTAGNYGGFSAEISITPAIPPCPPAALAGTSSASQVELQWPIVNGAACAFPASLPLSGYRVYRSTFSGGGYQPLAWSPGSAATTYVDATAVAGAVYYYAVRSYDPALPPNESVVMINPYDVPAFSPEVLGAPRVRAGSPGNLTAMATVPSEHDGAAKLSWVPSVPGTFTVLGYDVFRSTTVGGPETRNWVSGGDASTYLDVGLTNMRFYYYRVVPVEQNGFTGDWAAATATPYQDPSPPGSLTLVEGNGQLVLGWAKPAATSFAVTAYRVSRATFPGIAGAAALVPDPAWGTTFADSGVVNGTAYWYHVQTYDVPWHLSYAWSAEVSGTPFAPPAAPGWLTATSLPAGAALAWGSAPPTTYPVSAYQVLRGLTAGVAACTTCSVATVWDAAATVYADGGLVNGTTYFYAVRARDLLGHWGLGGNAAAVTPAVRPCPPATLTAAASAAQVALAWPFVNGGACGPPSTFGVSGYVVYRATWPGASVPSLTVTVGQYATAYTDATVVPGTSYYYRVRTFDNRIPVNEGTGFSPEVCAVPRVPAAAPTGLTILGEPYEHDLMLKLSWNASVAGSLPVAGYNVYRASCSACPQANVFGPGSAATLAYLDTGLANATYYYYRVAPVESKFFEGNWANVASTPYSDPAPPGTLTIREGDTQLVIGWSIPAATTWAVTAYRVSRATWPGITGLQVLTPDPYWSTTFTDPGLVNGQAYYYHVQTYDIFRHLSHAYSPEVSGTPFTPPGTPPNPGALPGDTKVIVSWDAAAPGTFPVSGYAIYRSLAPGVTCGGVPYRTVCCGALNLVDTGLTNFTTYYYKIAAFDSVSGGHLSGCTAEVLAQPQPTLLAPGKPSNLTAVLASSSVGLTWQPGSASTRPVSGYSIFRTTYAGSSALTQDTIGDTREGAGVVAYADMAATNGIVYYYRVRTRDDNTTAPLSATAYLSDPSNEVAAFPAAAPLGLTANPGSNQIYLQWQWTQAGPGGLGVTGYRVYRGTGAGGPFGLVFTTVAWPYATAWTDPATPPGQRLYYEVRAIHELGWAGPLSATITAVAGGPPSAPVLGASPGDGKVVLAWTACTSPFPPVTSYVVFRGTFAGFGASIPPRGVSGPAASPPLTYTDTGAGVTNGVPYYYRVASVDSSPGSTSTYSNEAYGLPLGTPLGLATTPGDGVVVLGWSPPADAGGVSGYLVYRRTLTLPEGVAGTVFGAATVAYTDTAVQNGVMYYYRVRVFDRISPPVSLGGFSAEALGRPATPPGAPPITFLAAGGQEIDLCWGPPGSSGTFPVSGYRVYRSSGAGPYALRAALLSGSCFADFPITNGVTWSYKVAAFDTEVPPVEGPVSNPVSGVPYAVPTAPLAVTAYAMPGSLLLGWSTAFVQSTYPVTGWNLYRGAASGAESGVPVNGAAITATFFLDTGLVDGTRYFYVLRTADSAGHSSVPSSEVAAAPFVPPGAPVVALTPADRRMTLAWTAVAGTFTPITTYAIYRATYAGFVPGAALVRLTSALTPTVYADLGVTNGTPYYYRVGAIDSDRTTGPHETRSAERFSVVLGVPMSLSALPGDTRATLSWTPPPGGTLGTSGYFIYRRTLFSAEAQVGVADGPGALGYVDATPPLSNGVTYYYRVAPYDRLAPPTNTGGFSPVAQTIPGNGPAAPTIYAITAGSQRVDLCWSPPSVLGSNPLAGYRIWRSSSGGAQTLQASVPTTVSCYGDAPLANGSVLTYRVDAIDTVGIPGPLSNQQSATPYTLPNPPGRLTVQLRNGALALGWATVYLAGSATVYVATTFPQNAFVVLRSLAPNVEAVPAVGSTAATTFVNTGLVNGTTYYYKVVTVDAYGHWSATSAEVSGVPYAPATAPLGLSPFPGNLAVMLSWRPGSAGTWTPLSGYYVYRGLAPGAETLLAGPVFATLYVDATAANGTPYWYVVRARDARGNPGNSSNEVGTTPSGSLVNPPLFVQAAMGAGGIAVSWGRTVVGFTPGGPTDQYVILRSTCASCGFDTLTPSGSVYVSSTVFAATDATAVAGRYYRYAVRSVALAAGYLESLDYPWSVAEVASACGPPNAPASIVATAGAGAVGLVWTPPGTTFACQLPLTYRLYRSANGGGTWVTMTATGGLAFTDLGAANGTSYIYRVNSVSSPGVESLTGAVSGAVTPVPRTSSAFLARNAFAPVRGESLDLAYTLDRDAPVTLRIFAISGLKVYEEKISSQPAGPPIGTYLFAAPGRAPGWDGKAADGRFVASGVYLVEFEAGTFRKQMKVIVIK